MKFAGHFMCIDRNNDETNSEEDVVIELVDLKADGTVEIRLDDRNEHCYLKFKVQDLVAATCLKIAGDE